MHSLIQNFPGQAAVAPNETTVRPRLHIFRYFNSKRLVVLAATFLIVLLLTFFHFVGLRRPSDLARGWPSTPGSQSAKSDVDWSRFAYTQHATNAPYLCNSIMLFEILHRLGSKAERLLMYPSEFKAASSDDESNESLLLRKARDEYNVKLSPIKTMDELFLLPSVPLALTRAYWLKFDDRVMSSQLLLIQPSKFEFDRNTKAIEAARSSEYDMEIINNLYRDNAMILPQRPYNLLTSEHHTMGSHKDYMGSEKAFDPEKVLKEAKFLRFSDRPVPKPWIPPTPQILDQKKPECIKKANGTDCRQQQMWLGFYSDFVRRRKEVCDVIATSHRKRRWAKRSTATDPLYQPLFH